MAHRTLGVVDGTSLFACSICGVPARFPTELEYTEARLFVHKDGRHGKNNMREDENRARGRIPPDQQAPRFPIGVKADWQA